MIYLTIGEILFLHKDLVDSYGGTDGIRDENLLKSAVFRCQTSFGGKDLYKDIFEKSAALFHSILFSHPFIDGNKRTGISSAIILLEKNGWKFESTLQELVTFPLFVEHTRPDISQIASWFKSHCKKIKK